MYFPNFIYNRSFALTVFYFFLFYLFITPYSIAIDGQGISANYLFVFFPIISLLINREMTWPPTSALLFMVILGLIFLVGSISQVDQYDLILRRSASFVIFMSIFAFMFVRLDLDMIRAFKLVIVLYTLYESSLVITKFINIDGNNIGYYAKGALGSQRIGFIYIMGFWLIALLKTPHKAFRVAKFFALYLALCAILLTYSRSCVVGLIGSTITYFIYILINTYMDSRSISATVLKFSSKALYLFMLLALFAIFFKGPVNFYTSKIFTYIVMTFSEELSPSMKIDLNSKLAKLKTNVPFEMSEAELKESSLIQKSELANIDKIKVEQLVLSNAEEIEKNEIEIVKLETLMDQITDEQDISLIKLKKIGSSNLNLEERILLDDGFEELEELTKEAKILEEKALSEIKILEDIIESSEDIKQKKLAKAKAIEVARQLEEAKEREKLAKARAKELKIARQLEEAKEREKLAKAKAIEVARQLEEAKAIEKLAKAKALVVARQLEEAKEREKLAKAEANEAIKILQMQKALELSKQKEDNNLLFLNFLESGLDNINISPSQKELFNFISNQVIEMEEVNAAQQDLFEAYEEEERLRKINEELQKQLAQRAQEVFRAELTDDALIIGNARYAYDEYNQMEKITYREWDNQKDKINDINKLLNFNLFRLMTIELEVLLNEKNAQLKSTKVQESINKINQKISDINVLFFPMMEKSINLEKRIRNINMTEHSNNKSSLGYRVYMHKLVLEKTFQSPLIGSSFLGVWSLFENQEGSTHSQYLDILFRVGVVAFIIYLLFIWRVTLFLYKKELALFLGFVGYSLVGLLHETIKLSQGGFVFAFLFAMWAQRKNLLKYYEKPS